MSREDFPLLKEYIFLDSASGSLKPKQVVEAISNFYLYSPINIHSRDSAIGMEVANQVESARKLTADLFDASVDEVIFTSGTTDGLNKIARMLEGKLDKPNIIVSPFNHSSNIIPWIEFAKRNNKKLIISENPIDVVDKNTALVAISQVNNTYSIDIDLKNLYKKVKTFGGFLINDAAQAVVHEKVALQEADAIVFSGNKIYGPTGIGGLIINKKWLKSLTPVTYGGGSNSIVNKDEWIPKEGIDQFEPGTLNTAGIIGLGAAIEYFNTNNKNLDKLFLYAYDKLKSLEGITVHSKRGSSIVIFNVNGVSSQDVVSYLGHKNILLRGGNHCARWLKYTSLPDDNIRISFGLYNTKEDIDSLIIEIKQGGDFLEFV